MKRIMFVYLVVICFLLTGCVSNQTYEEKILDDKDWECTETECKTTIIFNDRNKLVRYYIDEEYFSFSLKLADTEGSSQNEYIPETNELNVFAGFGMGIPTSKCIFESDVLTCDTQLRDLEYFDSYEEISILLIEYIEDYIS